MTSFPNASTTYQPIDLSIEALDEFGLGRFEPLFEELRRRDRFSYERVAADRAIAIAIDLALLGAQRKLSILDIGCSVGTISVLLSTMGHAVTGIDSDVVARVQEWQDSQRIDGARLSYSRHCNFIRTDIRDYLQSTEEKFHVALLLSVVHHWLSGYGYKGESKFGRAEVVETLKLLCSRTSQCIYIEVPIVDEIVEMPPDPFGEFHFPGWFLQVGLAKDVTLIAATIATNGKPRRLYRIDLR